jgi:hypothetical protein
MPIPSTVNVFSAANVIAPSKAPPLAENCCFCAILAVLCAGILSCGQAAWETRAIAASLDQG